MQGQTEGDWKGKAAGGLDAVGIADTNAQMAQ
jgi:hypothetical protein